MFLAFAACGSQGEGDDSRPLSDDDAGSSAVGGGTSGGGTPSGGTLSGVGGSTPATGGGLLSGGAGGVPQSPAGGMSAATGGLGGEGGGVEPIVPSAGPAWHGWVCPPGPFAERPFEDEAQAQAIAGVPLDDGFLEERLVVLEGPVWFRDELYFSELDGGPLFPVRPPIGAGGTTMGSGGNEGTGGGESSTGGTGGMTPDPATPPVGRVLRLDENGEVTVVLPDVGSNGLAVDAEGELFACSHKDGSLSAADLETAQLSPLVSSFMGERFNAPNDLAFGPDGSVYFTDPTYQALTPPPQEATRVYRFVPGAADASSVIDDRRQPNGIAFSVDARTLYLSSEEGVFAYAVHADGTLGSPEPFAAGLVNRSDGMGIDCAGNVYLTSGAAVVVVRPDGTELARLAIADVQSVTNVAFGGPDRKTLYVTSLGGGRGGVAGLFRLDVAIPGMPY